jgi:flagellin
MGFQISSNFAGLNAYNNLGVHQAKANAALARISSGLKASGGGDVASQGIANTMNTSLQTNKSSVSQIQGATIQLQAADAVYSEMIGLAQKGMEVANSSLNTGANFAAVDNQADGILAGINSLKANANFAGASVFFALADIGDLTPFTGLPVGPAVPLLLAAFTAPITDATSAGVVSAQFSAFIDEVVELRATNAGNLAALQNTMQALNSVAANEMVGISQAQDTDIATEMMNLTSANIMTEAATAMLAQAMQMPNSVLKLLQ